VTTTAENFLKDPNKYFDNAIADNAIIRVSAKYGDAVILSADEYQRQQNILETLKEFDTANKQFESGEYLSQAQVTKKIHALLEDIQ